MNRLFRLLDFLRFPYEAHFQMTDFLKKTFYTIFRRNSLRSHTCQMRHFYDFERHLDRRTECKQNLHARKNVILQLTVYISAQIESRQTWISRSTSTGYIVSDSSWLRARLTKDKSSKIPKLDPKMRRKNELASVLLMCRNRILLLKNDHGGNSICTPLLFASLLSSQPDDAWLPPFLAAGFLFPSSWTKPIQDMRLSMRKP